MTPERARKISLYLQYIAVVIEMEAEQPKKRKESTMSVKPLKKRTMTLNQLQLRTANFLRLVRFQLNRSPHDGGLTDQEFINQNIEPFETDIYQDRQVLKMSRRDKVKKETKSDPSPNQCRPI